MRRALRFTQPSTAPGWKRSVTNCATEHGGHGTGCADWLKGKRLRNTFPSARLTSYYYKHLVEAFRRGQGDADPYTYNGAFIAAAVGLGLDFKLSGLNVRFKISERELPHAR
jgi:hypothetical protein